MLFEEGRGRKVRRAVSVVLGNALIPISAVGLTMWKRAELGYGIMPPDAGRAQKVAIGFTGDPVPLGIASGAMVSRNSERLRFSHSAARASRSQQSRM